MPSKVDDLVLRIEAILFAAGKPLSVRELTEAAEAPDHRPIQQAIRTLQRTYESRATALEVRHVGDRYALQLRETFVPTAHRVSPVEMAPRTLKALTLIAYHQPVLQSTLARMLGEAAYEEVSRLRGLGLIHAEPKGATLELKTTRTFAEYFGIESTRPEEIRQFLEKKLGVAPAPPAGAAISIEPPPESPGPSEGPEATPDVAEDPVPRP
ncbi:MAG TPA: SMC-Scp complex subunit ScpB [Thermoplasmata archaeon]|nr:SMC-Scp complex subunit ScpB [Thermoplasmata archaeon]